MPSIRKIYDWMDEDPQFAADFARARERGHEAIEADIAKIADTIKDEANPVEVQRAKLRIETRLKLLKIWNPKKYGDRVQIEDDRPKLKTTREEALATLRTSGLSVADIFGALARPADQPINVETVALAENAAETTQPDDDEDLSELGT